MERAKEKEGLRTPPRPQSRVSSGEMETRLDNSTRRLIMILLYILTNQSSIRFHMTAPYPTPKPTNKPSPKPGKCVFLRF